MTLNFDTDILRKYFPDLTENQLNQFSEIPRIYKEKNEHINVISRKDVENIFIRHILHSLSIAKIIQFKKTSTVLDVGTGGGFPGIPLAIMFPDVQFTLIDSIAKKIKVVNEVSNELGLKNVEAKQIKSTQLTGSFDYITGRAVTAFPAFYTSVKHLIKKKSKEKRVLYLKGGDFDDEIKKYTSIKVYGIKDFFDDDFFETKKIIFL